MSLWCLARNLQLGKEGEGGGRKERELKEKGGGREGERGRGGEEASEREREGEKGEGGMEG